MSTTALFIISLAVGLVSAVVSIVAAVKAKNAIVNVGEEDSLTLGDISVTQQSEGLVIPIVYGNARICGNIIWWYAEKFGTVPNEQYRICMWQTLCMGTIINGANWFDTYGHRLNIWLDGKLVEFYAGIPGTQAPSEWYERLMPVSVGGDTALTGFGPPVDYLQYFPNDGVYATRLRRIAHVFVKFLDLPIGVSNIPTLKFRVWNDMGYFFTTTGEKFNTLPGIARHDYGVNPATIIYDLLTNVQYGLGLAETNINWASFVAASHYFADKLYYLNIVINQSMSVRDIIAKIQDWCECFLIKNADDEYELIFFQDSDADTPAAIVTDDDMIDFNLRRKSWNDTFNSFTGNYTQLYLPGTQVPGAFERKAATMKNEANILMTGSIRNKVIDLTAFMNVEGVNNRLSQIMKKESYPFATGTLSVNLKYSFLRLGSVFTIDSNEYNFVGPFRIIDIKVNETDKNQLDYEIIQLRELVADDISDPTSRAEGIYGEAVLVSCTFTLTFPPNSNISEPCPRAFIIDADSQVAWSAGQTLKGMLTYGTDYTIQDHVRVVLDPDIFEAEIMMNAYGLLSVDIYEPGCPSPPTES